MNTNRETGDARWHVHARVRGSSLQSVLDGWATLHFAFSPPHLTLSRHQHFMTMSRNCYSFLQIFFSSPTKVTTILASIPTFFKFRRPLYLYDQPLIDHLLCVHTFCSLVPNRTSFITRSKCHLLYHKHPHGRCILELLAIMGKALLRKCLLQS